MPRITCAQIATVPEFYAVAGVSETFTTFLDPPDFSIPPSSDPQDAGLPEVSGRLIAPGEIYTTRPIIARCRNDALSSNWIEMRFVLPSGTNILAARVTCEGGRSVQLAAQGLALRKMSSETDGVKVQLRVSSGGLFDVYTQGLVRRASNHVGIA